MRFDQPKRQRLLLQAAVGIVVLGTIAGLLGGIFGDEIYKLWFEQTTVRPYIAANFTPHVRTLEAERALKPGESFQECAKDSKACPEMVVVPAGEFWMGSPDSEGHASERPRHKVTIAARFAVGKFEVTSDEWSACVRMRGCAGRPMNVDLLMLGFDDADKPLINVSWDQAKDYVVWLSRMTGKTYRLLTEAEWEYAARGITSADAPHPPYPWGDKASHEYANYLATEGRDKWKYTAPVGRFPPNAFGLHDMHGNVWEWVEDIWHDDYSGTPPTTGHAWTEGGDASHRIVRGGSWISDPEGLRSAGRNRFATDPGRYGPSVGFRVGRTLTPEPAR
jgi:formylglycine-generating enzyme required for sulfatase activity